MDSSHDDTSLHVRRATSGTEESVAWLVERFGPFLELQAQLRMGPALRSWMEPQDVVAEVWTIALPRLDSLRLAETGSGAILARWLSTMLLHRVLDLSKAARRRGAGVAPPPPEEEASPWSGVITRLAREERRSTVHEVLTSLPRSDQEVLVFRGLEQRPLAEVAAQLDMKPGTVAVRYHRALGRLRERLPASLAEEFPTRFDDEPGDS